MADRMDYSLGPTLPYNQTTSQTRVFDFTLTFENIVFILVPNVVALPLTLYRVWLIHKQPKVLDWPAVRVFKLIILVSLEALQLAQAVLTIKLHLPARYTVPSFVLLLVTVASLAVLSPLDHAFSVRPSGIIQAYMFFTLLLDIPRLRTAWLISKSSLTNFDREAMVQTVAFAVKIVILIMESLPKGSRRIEHGGKALSAEDKAGAFSRSLLLWLNPLLRTGYTRRLTMDDLDTVGEDLEASKLVGAVETPFRRYAGLQRRLAWSLLSAFLKELAMIQVPRLVLVGFSIAQPYLILSTLEVVQASSDPAQFGNALIGGFALTYIGIAISTLWYQHLTFRLLTMVRGALIGMIFQHSLKLPIGSDSSDAINLMSTDIDRITQTLQWVLNVLPNIIQVGLALWILYTQLGLVFFSPLVVAIIISIVASFVGRLIPPRQRKWLQAIRKRVEVTTGIIRSIRSVKLSGLTNQAMDQITVRRVSEIADQKAFRRIQVSNITIGNIPAMITPAVTFAAYAIAQAFSQSSQFSVTTAFTSLSLLSIMINPIAELVTAATNLGSALSCLDRIQEFLEKPGLPSEGLSIGIGPIEDIEGKATASDSSALFRLADAVLGYKNEKPILNNINKTIFPSTFTIITGPVGTGKSTFLRALLGEVDVLQGTFHSSRIRQIAYCDQKPWILNTSVRDNILGITDYNAERYHKVIKACQLQDDFDKWELGDGTFAGSSGILLSGGQKARISLARAAYSGKQVFLLDDSFAGLDNETAQGCFDALLGIDGLLRQTGMTVVMATHTTKFFSYADDIIVLDKNGQISAQGGISTIERVSPYIQELFDKQQSIEVKPMESHPSIDVIPTAPTSSAADEQEHAVTVHADSEPEVGQALRGDGALRYYLSAMGQGTIFMFAGLVILNIGCNVAQPLWLRSWTADNERDPNTGIGSWVGVYMLFAVANVVMIGVETGFALLLLIPKASLSLHQQLLTATMKAPLSFFVNNDSGKIVNILTGDLNLVDLALPISFILTFEKTLAVIAEIVLTCIASGYLAISIPFILLCLFLLQRIYITTSRQLRVLELEQKAPLFENFISTFEGLTTLRAYSWMSVAEARNTILVNDAQRPFYLLFCLQRWITLVLDLVTAAQAIFIVGLAVALRHSIDPGFLGVALTSVMTFGQTASALTLQWTNLETSLGAVQRIMTYVKTAPSEEGCQSKAASDEAKQAKDEWPSFGHISLKNVSASYGSHKVLNNINFDVAAGSKTIICGRTGSGKSTVLGLMLRLLDVDSGSVQIDGVDINTLSPNKIRTAIVGLPQDPLLLHGTVRLNLDSYGQHQGEDGDACLMQALEKTGLAQTISEMGGLDVELSHEWLSYGQHQLLCLARAMLRNKSKVLLLDEATSHLDAQTRRTVDRLIKSEFEDWTVVVVTHHLESVLDAESAIDQVVLLRRGTVAEAGSPADLMRRSEGEFRKLVNMERRGGS